MRLWGVSRIDSDPCIDTEANLEEGKSERSGNTVDEPTVAVLADRVCAPRANGKVLQLDRLHHPRRQFPATAPCPSRA